MKRLAIVTALLASLFLLIGVTPSLAATNYCDLARESTSTLGSGTVTLGGALTGYLSFTGAGCASGTVSYSIIDGAKHETGRGTYDSVAHTVTRCDSHCTSSNSNNPLSLDGNAVITITAEAADFSDALSGNFPNIFLPSGGRVDWNSGVSKLTGDGAGNITFDTGTTSYPTIKFSNENTLNHVENFEINWHNGSASGTIGDTPGFLIFTENNSAGTNTQFAQISVTVNGVTAGAENGELDFQPTINGNTNAIAAMMGHSSALELDGYATGFPDGSTNVLKIVDATVNRNPGIWLRETGGPSNALIQEGASGGNGSIELDSLNNASPPAVVDGVGVVAGTFFTRNDGTVSIGSGTKRFANLYLAYGGEINWNNGPFVEIGTDFTSTSNSWITDMGTAAGPNIDFINHHANANDGPFFVTYQNTGATSAGKGIAFFDFQSDDSAGVCTTCVYAELRADMVSTTHGAITGALQVRARVAGTLKTLGTFGDASQESNGFHGAALTLYDPAIGLTGYNDSPVLTMEGGSSTAWPALQILNTNLHAAGDGFELAPDKSGSGNLYFGSIVNGAAVGPGGGHYTLVIEGGSTPAIRSDHDNEVTLGGAGTGWKGEFLASGTDIDWGNGNFTLSHSSSNGLALNKGAAASNVNIGGSQSDLQITNPGNSGPWLTSWMTNAGATAGANGVIQTKSRGSTVGDVTIVQNGDILGIFDYAGADGVGYIIGAEVRAIVDGTPGVNNVPMDLLFRTGSNGTTTRMTIFSDGGISIGAPTGGDKGAGTLNVAGAYYGNGTVGVTCSGTPTAGFASTNGIVTHC